jgi:hypothetical protein
VCLAKQHGFLSAEAGRRYYSPDLESERQSRSLILKLSGIVGYLPDREIPAISATFSVIASGADEAIN